MYSEFATNSGQTVRMTLVSLNLDTGEAVFRYQRVRPDGTLGVDDLCNISPSEVARSTLSVHMYSLMAQHVADQNLTPEVYEQRFRDFVDGTGVTMGAAEASQSLCVATLDSGTEFATLTLTPESDGFSIAAESHGAIVAQAQLSETGAISTTTFDPLDTHPWRARALVTDASGRDVSENLEFPDGSHKLTTFGYTTAGVQYTDLIQDFGSTATGGRLITSDDYAADGSRVLTHYAYNTAGAQLIDDVTTFRSDGTLASLIDYDQGNTSALAERAYTFDAAGHIALEVDRFDDGATARFTYDALNRLDFSATYRADSTLAT